MRCPVPSLPSRESYYLNVRVPYELREGARGRAVTLPIANDPITVTISDKVYVSLRTKSAPEANRRFQDALSRLSSYWDSLRVGPDALKPYEVKALAAESCREAVAQLDADFAFNDRIEAFVNECEEGIQWRPDNGVDDPVSAEREASIEMQDPLALHAFALRHGDGLLSRDEIVEAEPRRFSPRPFRLSHAAMAGSSSMAW